MSSAFPDHSLPARSNAWKWWVCGLLLLATTVNYMDRLTINLLGPDIRQDLRFDKEHYGWIEFAFGMAFAVGSLVMGWTVDRFNVFWVYPFAVLIWSGAGFVTGFATSFAGLVLFRILLGLAESANWPCALRTTQRILPPEERTMGNSILQSGAALGAILTPMIVGTLFVEGVPDSWRSPFWVVGIIGAFWVVLWWSLVRKRDLALPVRTDVPATELEPDRPALPTNVFIRRFAALMVLVVAINLSWHFLRAWLPLFLREYHGYSARTANNFFMGYYLAADIGSLSAGFLTLYLIRRGGTVHGSRLLVFLVCSLLAALAIVAAVLPKGPWLLAVLFLVGFGALGVFPNYYAFSQELTVRNQGKVTGGLGFFCWVCVAGMHALVGKWVEHTGSYTEGLTLAGLSPLVGFIVFTLLWGKTAAAKALPTVPTELATVATRA